MTTGTSLRASWSSPPTPSRTLSASPRGTSTTPPTASAPTPTTFRATSSSPQMRRSLVVRVCGRSSAARISS
eukprot:6070810-Alexandrium_andersonii.AAC.1